MKLVIPHFANTLLFRISATFLLLMGVSLGAYYFWIDRTVFNPYQDEAEENWYENLAEDELDSLAVQLAQMSPAADRADSLLTAYGDRVRDFRAEVIVFDDQGRYLRSSAPDSLPAAVPQVSVELLREMKEDEWDYGSYPIPDDIDAFENRIFGVDEIRGADGEAVAGYLVVSFLPISVASQDLNSDARLLDAQQNILKALVGLLIYSAVTALLIMGWTSRRVRQLSEGVESFAGGDFTARVPVRSSDEIGTLAVNFNDMAASIEAMVEKLRQKEQFQSQLVANVSHDLRTPMASMRGYLETLLMDDKRLDNRERARCLTIIKGNLDHLNRLVEHTLVLSRFDTGQATFHFEDFSIAELADSILLRFERLAADKNLTLDLEVADDVSLVHADPLQIAQVLQNLVENAIKFNRIDGGLTVGLAKDGDRVSVEVRDTGQGIPAADLPHIFKRFYTVDKSRTRPATDTKTRDDGRHLGQSSGLGLAIATKIIAGHDSTLQVESELDQGTVFRFHLAPANEDRQALVGRA